jgi:hypothetical protein
MLIVAMVTPMLGGCFENGSPASPPSNLAVTAGDGRVTLTWTADPGVDYWLFTATDPSLTAFNWLGLPNGHAYVSAVSPYYLCGLYSGTPYWFAANGRTNGGPGGPSSSTITTTNSPYPYNASAVTWTAPPPPTNGIPSSTNLNGVGYTSLTTCSNNTTSAAGSFAAVGAGGQIYTSSDGKIWNAPTSPIVTPLNAVTGYAANQNNPSNPGLLWVAVGDGGASVYSTDGINWATGNLANAGSPANPTNQALRSITHVAGTFFAVGDAGTILSSIDGITWTSYTATSGTTNPLRGVTHGSIYVAVGDNGTILTSGNGINWTVQTSITPSVPATTLRQVTSFGSIIVAVGNSGTIVTSKDNGATWAVQTSGTTNDLVGITAESQFVYVANPVIDPLLGFFASVQFVAVDSLGNVYTSHNGYTWSTANATGISVNALVSSGFGYVTVGNAGVTAYAF